jgi:uncharacterized phage protein (TIGR01671 family)
MSREFKFRAWDIDSSTMLYPKDFSHDEFYIEACEGVPFLMCSSYDYSEWSGPTSREAVIMQSTGITDIKGKEIWEGDILNVKLVIGAGMGVDTGIQEQINIVEWNDYGFEPFLEFGLPDYDVSYEIIGNIYENSELINVD